MTRPPTTTEPTASKRARVMRALGAPVDAAGLAAFRILFGLLAFVAMARFLASGWIPRLYGEPRFFFKYWGFAWVEPWPVWGVTLHYAVLAVLALGVALGLCYRASIVLFTLGFTWAQLFDVTNYLNHGYLVSLLAGLMAFMPLHRAWSIDAWRHPALRSATLPAWCLALLRFQIAVVYVFAGLAKLNSDWLLHAQPLSTWLSARSETPLIGPLLDERWVAYVASWGAFLYDTTIVAWLLHRRTRLPAFVVLVGFHVLTGVFFNIGMFPWIMTIAAVLWFPPSWPRRLVPSRLAPTGAPPPPAPAPWRRLGLTALAVYALVQVALPVRYLAYPGDLLWREEGMRFGWKVMLREKHGSVTFHVRLPDGRTLQVPPRRYLTPRQEREMGAQPDLILQLARHIAREYDARGLGPVEVRAEAVASLNGRPVEPLVDPTRDLAREHDGLAVKDWILPGPREESPDVAVVAGGVSR